MSSKMTYSELLERSIVCNGCILEEEEAECNFSCVLYEGIQKLRRIMKKLDQLNEEAELHFCPCPLAMEAIHNKGDNEK